MQVINTNGFYLLLGMVSINLHTDLLLNIADE